MSTALPLQVRKLLAVSIVLSTFAYGISLGRLGLTSFGVDLTTIPFMTTFHVILGKMLKKESQRRDTPLGLDVEAALAASQTQTVLPPVPERSVIAELGIIVSAWILTAVWAASSALTIVTYMSWGSRRWATFPAIVQALEIITMLLEAGAIGSIAFICTKERNSPTIQL